MAAGAKVSRRDFLRLRRTEQGKLLELSCRALFMRVADAAIEPAPAAEWEPWMGEPPAVIHRRSPDELFDAFEAELRDVQVLRLLDAEWLESLTNAPRIHAAVAAFRARGGVVELSADTTRRRV